MYIDYNQNIIQKFLKHLFGFQTRKIGTGGSAFNPISRSNVDTGVQWYPSRVKTEHLVEPPNLTFMTPSKDQHITGEMPALSMEVDMDNNLSDVSPESSAPKANQLTSLLAGNQPSRSQTPTAPENTCNLTDAPVREVSKAATTPEVFHKKFDRMRKHMIHSNTEKKTEEEPVEMAIKPFANGTHIMASQVIETVDKFEEKEMPKEQFEDSTKEKPKLSAVEKHPQLLAHLKAPNPNIQQHTGFGFSPVVQPSNHQDHPILNIPQRPLMVVGGAQSIQSNTQDSHSKPDQGEIIKILGQPLDNSQVMKLNTKEQFHATAVSHLKDKLMRKFDSMENLQKIGPLTDNDVSAKLAPSVDAPNGVQVLKTSSGHTIPVYSSQQNTINNSNVSGGQLYQGPIYAPAMLNQAFPALQSRGGVMSVPAYNNQHLAGMQQLTWFYNNGTTWTPQKK